MKGSYNVGEDSKTLSVRMRECILVWQIYFNLYSYDWQVFPVAVPQTHVLQLFRCLTNITNILMHTHTYTRILSFSLSLFVSLSVSLSLFFSLSLFLFLSLFLSLRSEEHTSELQSR